MWVFDGEEWTEDDGSEKSTAKPETPQPRYEQFMPELQVIEIVPIPMPRNTHIPPLPLP